MKWDGVIGVLCDGLGISEGLLVLRRPASREGLTPAGQHGLARAAADHKLHSWVREWADRWAGAATVLRAVEVRAGRAAPPITKPLRIRNPEKYGRGVWKSPELAGLPLTLGTEVAGFLIVGSAPLRDSAAILLTRHLTLELEFSRLQERLRRLDRVATLGEMVYHVAHEINNPLTTVVGYAELLTDRLSSPAEARPGQNLQTVERLRAEAERALGISRNVLSLSHSAEEKVPCDLNGVLLRALSLREYALRVAGIEARTDLEPDLPLVEISPGRIQQAFLNILINSEQAFETSASDPGIKWVEIGASRSPQKKGGEGVTVKIRNNGPPIPEDYLSRIFDPFFTSKPVGVGTGLGLPIAKAAVDASGGWITAANELDGVAFRMWFPALREAELALPSRPRAGARALRGDLSRREAALPGKWLLVVEDEPSIAQLIEDVFRPEGCHLAVCGTAEEALRLAGHRRFDAVISDLKLPGKGGIWLFEQFSRSLPEISHKTLFITGDMVSSVTAEFLRSSGQPALAKPFHVRELKAAVENLLAGVLVTRP